MRAMVAVIVAVAGTAGCAELEDAGATGDTGVVDEAEPGGPEVSCEHVIPETFGSGGCRIYLVSPANCAEVDFPPGGVVEFAWTTDGSFCEGPHHVLLGGHPVETWYDDNGFLLDLSSTDGEFRPLGGNGSSYAMTRNLGGVVRLAEADLRGITTTTGQFHWAVQDFYALENGGSISASNTFTVRAP